MRDLDPLRLRLLAAMGLVTAVGAAGCGGGPTPAKIGTVADASADVPPGDLALADGPADTLAVPDTVSMVDSIAETSDSDAPATQDIAAPDAADAPDAAADQVAGPDAIAPPVCSAGGNPVQTCYGAAALKATIESPSMGGDGEPKKYDGPLPPEGCAEPALVQDGCCNAAVGHAILQSDTCCYWHCPGACCGRPLEVDGKARVAALVERADWLGSEGQAEAPLLEPSHALALAAAWRADAADEHAAIASFQRFGLDLLALGAPPDLVLDAMRAAGDEVGHARACFAIAARLDAKALGPAPLDCSGVQARGDLLAAAVAAVREGCVGETLAAACAGAAARSAADGAIAAALGVIAEDEARHAELGWRFVAWAHATGTADVREAIAAAFAAAVLARPEPDPRETWLIGVPDGVRQRFGRLPGGVADRLRQRVLAEVVAPCAERLLGRAMGRPARFAPVAA